MNQIDNYTISNFVTGKKYLVFTRSRSNCGTFLKPGVILNSSSKLQKCNDIHFFEI